MPLPHLTEIKPYVLHGVLTIRKIARKRSDENRGKTIKTNAWGSYFNVSFPEYNNFTTTKKKKKKRNNVYNSVYNYIIHAFLKKNFRSRHVNLKK